MRDKVIYEANLAVTFNRLFVYFLIVNLKDINNLATE